MVKIASFVVNVPHQTNCKLRVLYLYKFETVCIYMYMYILMCRVFSWPWPRATKGKQCTLYQSEIRYLHPEQGLSDGVIDFFVRFV